MIKKTAEVVIEQDKEVSRILQKAAQQKHSDLESWEGAIRAAVLRAGAKALGELIWGIGCGRREAPMKCSCGATMDGKGLKGKTLLTILGPVEYRRSMFECPICGQSRYPGDEELDVVGTMRSPGLRRMMARAGSRNTFKDGCEDLRVYAGINVSAKEVERVAERIGEDMEQWSKRQRQDILRQEEPVRKGEDISIIYVCTDGTGVPMTKTELQGRKGKHTDGSAKTREVKLGCVFTQTSTDSKGFPVRDPDSTSFAGAIETAEQFGWRIYTEAIRRELDNAKRVVVLGDAAAWIKNLTDMHFPGATQIIDLYHARQHVSDLCKILFAPDEKKVAQNRIRFWSLLDEGRIEIIVQRALKKLPKNPDAKKKAEQEIAYLQKNKERMRYAGYRADGLFVGSGVVEAGCKTVIGKRLKHSGMEWSVRGANAIIALRCMMKSGRFEDYWEDRVA
ncbi:hypothetical protein BMS3Bbin06_00445 [bacterium BMS3Bbin06]|nr:hypothetical protein BMS3Abin08_02163 [bacterium BMS3Abin08]GBE33930.1 hypothetical protein BMS3Bbin06_00445 [bacterium BMS3Bbin06]